MLRRMISTFATVALIVVLMAGCSSDSTTTTTTASATTAAAASGTIAVTLADVDADTMLLTPTPDSAPAGEVTFEVTNSGDKDHEFLVVKTDLGIEDLPLDTATDRVPEGDIDVLDEIEGIKPGETKTLTLTLESGNYALICNLEGHYRKGMRSAFTVN
jgi:uncharacterized cupredoxin-like copper-binding protein